MTFNVSADKSKPEGVKKYKAVTKDGSERIFELSPSERKDFFLQGVDTEEVKESYEVKPSKEQKEAESKLPVPLYPYDEAKYPDKERLGRAIKKTNDFFNVTDQDEILEYMDVTDYTLYWEEGTDGYDMRKIYAHYLEKNYLDPRTEEEKEKEAFGI